jgi:hypothetical protein
MNGCRHGLFDGAWLGDSGRRRDVLFEALRLNDLHWRRNVLLEVGLCGSRLLVVDDQRWLLDWLLVARFVPGWLLGPRLVRSRLLLTALLRPLLRPLVRLAVAIPLTMTIAPAAPVLFSLLGRLLARIGEAAFRSRRARLLRLLRLWRPRGPLLLLSFAAGARTIPLRAA